MATADAVSTLATFRKQFAEANAKLEAAEQAYLTRLSEFQQAEKRLKVVEGELRLATAQVTTLAKIFVTTGDAETPEQLNRSRHAERPPK